ELIGEESPEHGGIRLARQLAQPGQTVVNCTAGDPWHGQEIAVTRELQAAEKRAKEEGGRDAFSLTVVKRAGGALSFTAKWGEHLELLLRFR
ncbi:hypothetical protein ACMYLP_23145, partial [Salmonella enterica subsp. enterica serovar Enteritidis]|uniref:hypothetical protein n=1 Tax=Salmonella enterica TaxID=28901 RepID=UPI0039EB33C9